MRVHIVPSYQCNLNCEYCYAEPFQKTFSHSLGMEQFVALISRLMHYDLTSVSFLGGEPTLWPHLSDGMSYLKKLGVKRLLYTNGLILNGIPDMVIVNITDWKRSGINGKTLTHLQRYANDNSVVIFRINLQKGDSDTYTNEILTAAKTVQAKFSIGVLDAEPYDVNYGHQIFAFCTRLLESYCTPHLSRPLPYCIFTSSQRDFLKTHCHLRGTCNIDTAVPVINPDGRTVFPCNSIPVPFPLEYIYQNRSDFLKGPYFSDSFANILPEPCRICELWKEGVCQSGCLGMRWPATQISDSCQ